MSPSTDILTSDRVRQIFVDCLFQEGEKIENPVLVAGIIHRAGFHPGRLAAHTEEIKAMLLELPYEFRQTRGGGWSFLNACMDRHGNQWTGLQKVQEQLFLLGLGLGLVACPLPASMWPSLPGGMPYYVVLDRNWKEGPHDREHRDQARH